MSRTRSIRVAWDAAWRLAVLSLPWQTRWFSDASLAGWPWEQGRVSFYVSWLLILATIIVSFIRKRPTFSKKETRYLLVGALAFVVLCVAGTGFDPRALRAAGQWAAQIILLILFGFSLWQSGVTRRQFATWVVMSLLPHVALGFWQYAIQKVIGHPWLGMATQLPENPGVSVVEHGAYRVLRMYGGFPHPNIFGGWCAVGLLLSVWLAATADSRSRALGWSFASAAISVALLLTYARGAWIAAAVGVVVMAWHVRKHQFALVALAASMLAMGVVGYSQRDHILSRFDRTQRLEAKSLDARASSLKLGLDLFLRHPMFGTGPNAELLDAAHLLSAPTSRAPLEPPHDAYLLALVNVGVAGGAALLYLAWMFLRFLFRQPDRGLSISILATLAILGLFDHYLWSLWAGQALVLTLLTPRLNIGKIGP